MPETIELKEMIDNLFENREDLSDWEYNFITSIVKQVENAGTTEKLSDKQVACIARMYSNYY